MSRNPPVEPEDEPPGDDSGPGPGRLRPVSAAAVTAWAVVGLVGGWLWHPLAEAATGSAPLVTWLQLSVPWVVALILAGAARTTWRAVHRQRVLVDANRAVNRLLLARSSALVGALVAGGYLGYAVSWLNTEAELGGQRAWRSTAAAAGGLAMLLAAKWLEGACRVHSDDEG